jgi:hypothetical protein
MTHGNGREDDQTEGHPVDRKAVHDVEENEYINVERPSGSDHVSGHALRGPARLGSARLGME